MKNRYRKLLSPPLVVALVLGGAFASRVRADAHYTVPGDGTVKDNWTGLTWQQTVADGGGQSWDAAGPYCSALGGGWRLPSVKELSSLVDDTSKRSPPMDPTAFPNPQPADYFWSSSVYASGSSYAWSVGFDFGDVGALDKGDASRVRCVR